MSLPLTAGRLLLAVGLICLSLAACGRRGALEAPPEATAAPAKPAVKKVERAPRSADPAVAALEAEEDEDPSEAATEAMVPSPTPTKSRRSRNFTIPKEPFFLDPLL